MGRNIYLIYFLAFSRFAWFWLGIWIFYYLRFTNYAGIGFIETALVLSATLCQIPTGIFADVFGRKITLIFSFFLQTVGTFFLAFAPSVLWLALGVFILGIGSAFYSGTIDALLYDSLKQIGKEGMFDRYISKVTSIGMVAPAICGIIGGYLYTKQPNLPFLIHGVIYILGFVAAFFILEPKIETNKFSLSSFTKQFTVGFQELFKNNFLTEQTLLLLSTATVSVLCLEVLNDIIAVYLGFTPTQLALFWSFLYVFCAVASYVTPTIGKYVSYKKLSVILGLFIAISLIASPFVGLLLGGVTLLIRSSSQAMYENVTSVLLNKSIQSEYRATALSTFNLLKYIPYLATAYIIGVLVDKFSGGIIAMYLGIFLIVVIILQMAFYSVRMERK